MWIAIEGDCSGSKTVWSAAAAAELVEETEAPDWRIHQDAS